MLLGWPQHQEGSKAGNRAGNGTRPWNTISQRACFGLLLKNADWPRRAIRHSDMLAVVRVQNWHSPLLVDNNEALVGCMLDGTNREIV